MEKVRRQRVARENMYRGARTIAQRLTRRDEASPEDCRSGKRPESGAKFEFLLRRDIITLARLRNSVATPESLVKERDKERERGGEITERRRTRRAETRERL